MVYSTIKTVPFMSCWCVRIQKLQWLQCSWWDLRAKHVHQLRDKKVSVGRNDIWQTGDSTQAKGKYGEQKSRDVKIGDKWSPSFRQTLAFPQIFTLKIVLDKEVEVWCNIAPVIQQVDLDPRWTLMGQTFFRGLLKAKQGKWTSFLSYVITIYVEVFGKTISASVLSRLHSHVKHSYNVYFTSCLYSWNNKGKTVKLSF